MAKKKKKQAKAKMAKSGKAKSRKTKKPVAVKDLGPRAAKSMKTGLAMVRRRLV